MSAFFLVEINKVSDAEKYGLYIEKVASIINKHEVEYIFKSEQLTPVSGDWDTKRIVLIRFENKKLLMKCFRSEEYREIVYLREQSTESKAVIIED